MRADQAWQPGATAGHVLFPAGAGKPAQLLEDFCKSQ